MKTKTLLLLGLLTVCFVTPVKAQNGVNKSYSTSTVAFTLECTGDYIYGDVVYYDFLTPTGWVEKVRNATLIGYTDATLTVRTGRVYELSQCDTGKFDGTQGELLARLTVNGKIVAINHILWRLVTNANGVVTVDFFNNWWDCK